MVLSKPGISFLFKLLTLLTLVYAALLVTILGWSKNIASQTMGGISASEVIEGTVPGGLVTLLVILILLLFLTIPFYIFFISSGEK